MEEKDPFEKGISGDLAPFVIEFTLAVIMTLRGKKLPRKDKTIMIHADMVPNVSKEVMRASMKEKILPPRRYHPQFQTPKPIMKAPPRPLPKPQVAPMPAQGQIMVTPAPGTVLRPVPQQSLDAERAWEKLDGVLMDQTVSSIECPGPNQRLMVIRMGQRQITNIVLTEQEIHYILETVADQTHIPLLEGVFRAAVDEFSIHAVISQMIGSKFVMKKQTAYSMLER